LYNLSRNLEALSKKTQEDREFIMRLAPLYQQDSRNLPVERLEDLGLALLEFDTLTDLDNWLHP